MRPINGLDRPIVQWSFVAVAVILMVVAGAGALSLRRVKGEVSTLKQAVLDAALEKRQLELRLSREQAARETLSREVSSGAGGAARGAIATLTLDPRTHLSSSPPAATVRAPDATRVVELRLRLPSGVRSVGPFTVTMRSWSGGEVIWMRAGLTATSLTPGVAVVTRLSGDALPPGAYEFTLTMAGPDGAREIASYEVAIGQDR